MFQLEEHVSPTRTALLVVDVQNDFCHPDGYHGRRGARLSQIAEMIPRLERLLDESRKAGVPAIFIATHHSSWTNSPSWLARRRKDGGDSAEDSCTPGSWGAAFYHVSPTEDELVVIKHRYSAFIDTDLDLILRSRQIDNLLITGVNTNVCVDSTARHAYMLDYFVTVIEDCCATTSPQEDHEAALRLLSGRFAKIATSEELIQIWQRADKELAG